MIPRDAIVGVLKGGLAAERAVSLESGAAVAGALRQRGWTVVEVDVGRDLPAQLVAHRIDVAWLALHGRFGEDGCVQGLLEIMGIPYTGSGVCSSAVAMDKAVAKRVVTDVPGIVLADDRLLAAGDALPADLPVPSVVKPTVGGSTMGMSIVESYDVLASAITKALELSSEVLVEAFVEGDEITVAVIDGEALPVVRIQPDSGFFDYEAKYTKGRTHYEVPAQIPERAALQAQQGAVNAFKVMGCRGLCRVDFIVRGDGVPVFLELNTLPGMTETSLSPMAAKAAGVTFGELVERVLHGAHCMPAEV